MADEKKQFDFSWFFFGAFLALLAGIGDVFVLFLMLHPDTQYLSLVKWIYILPLAWLLKRGGYPEAAAGLLVGSGIVFMINTSCFGFFWEPGNYQL